MAIGDGFLGQPRGDLQRPAVGVERGGDPIGLEQRPDARPTGAGSVLVMALHAEIAHPFNPLNGLVNKLVAFVTHADGELCAFLHVDYH